MEDDCHNKTGQIIVLEETLASIKEDNNALQKEIAQCKDQKLNDCLSLARQKALLEYTLASGREQKEALQKELAQYRCMSRSGSQTGAVEPAKSSTKR